jgi:hypothetical protein
MLAALKGLETKASRNCYSVLFAINCSVLSILRDFLRNLVRAVNKGRLEGTARVTVNIVLCSVVLFLAQCQAACQPVRAKESASKSQDNFCFRSLNWTQIVILLEIVILPEIIKRLIISLP